MTSSPLFKRFMRYVVVCLGFVAGSPAFAVTISDNPLFIPTALSPNIILTLDDSGSMAWAFAPDDRGYSYVSGYIWSSINSRRFKSAAYNPMYYNPAISYDLGVNADGTARSTSFTAAKQNGFYDYGSNNTVNLSTSYRPSYLYAPASNTNDYASNPTADFSGQENSGVPAYYYTFNSALANCDGTLTDEDCYQKVNVTATSGPGSTDERQNFANWYSFYRTRNLMTVTAASRAFASLPTTARVAWQALNSCNSFGTSCSGWGGAAVTNKIRTFTGTQRNNFYAWLSRLPASGGTPLLEAMERAGEYYKTTGTDSPYAYDPGTTDAPAYSCRPNFHVLMTDGIWNNNTLANAYGNYDNTSRTLPDTKGYTARNPYKDDNSNSLADIAFYYWANDLVPTLTNNLIPHYVDRAGTADQQYWNAKNNPATWQHMVNFTVGLGLNTLLTNPDWAGSTYAGDYSNLVSGAKTWPATGDNVSPGNVADLWHAAINSRGQFFGADDPDALNTAFQSALTAIQGRTSAAAALATNSTRLGADTVIYQAKFDSSDWTGQLIAYGINTDGTLGNKVWDATDAGKIPAAASRNIASWSGTAGIDFLWGSLTGTQKTAIDSANAANASSPVLDYLRGDQSGELQNGGSYRNRTRRLGDIVNSDPAFVHAPNFGYGVLTEGSASGATPYATFVNANKSRIKALYVGANDGMLHAFDASTGSEKFAYVPNAVVSNLALLKNTAYTHKFFVDGSPFVGDAFIGGAWKTILLGTTGAGGKAVFALDVTDPTNFSSAKVLWEFTHSELGNTIGQPIIARLGYNSRWAAIFGNGYNSTGGTAKLFIVFLDANAADGWQQGKDADYMVIDTDNAIVDNGLSAVSLYDSNSDKVSDTVYAGDLQGNVWKFGLSDANPNNWGVAYKQGATSKPLFTARNASNQVQPITSPVEIGVPPAGKSGVMIYFGTGSFFATGDNTNTDVQSVYGVLDSGTRVTTTDRSELQQQSIIFRDVDTASSKKVTVLSNNTLDWTTKRGWYIDMLQPPSGTAQGERVVSIPLLRHGRVIFATLIPSADPCSFGGDSWTIEFDAITGGRLSYSVFDINNDGKIDSSDNVTITVGGQTITVPASGVWSSVGITKTPTVVTAGALEYKLASGTTGEINTIKEKGASGGTGRVSWRELME